MRWNGANQVVLIAASILLAFLFFAAGRAGWVPSLVGQGFGVVFCAAAVMIRIQRKNRR